MSDAADEAWQLMGALFEAQRPRLLELVAELDLTATQAQALMVLQPGAPRPMSEMANTMHCDRSNITGIVDRLEARGLVERRPADHDRRVKVLVLTEAGLAARERAMAPFRQAPPELAALPAADQAALRDILRQAVEPSGKASPAEPSAGASPPQSGRATPRESAARTFGAPSS